MQYNWQEELQKRNSIRLLNTEKEKAMLKQLLEGMDV